METNEDLETGYRASTPLGDNLSNDYNRTLAEGYMAMGRARGAAVEVDEDVALTDAGSPSLFANMALVLRPLTESEWRAVAGRMRAFFGRRAGGPYLVFSAWPTPDLAGQDFGRIGHPPLMLRPPAPLAVELPAGAELREAAGQQEAEDWERVLVDGFPLTELQPWTAGCLLPASAVGLPGWHHWVAYLDGRPAATAAAHVSPTHVDVEFVATLEEARGRGLGRALTATATLADPALPALLIASDPGRPIYERLGYRAILRYTLWAGHR